VVGEDVPGLEQQRRRPSVVVGVVGSLERAELAELARGCGNQRDTQFRSSDGAGTVRGSPGTTSERNDRRSSVVGRGAETK
jgi:hypothetical protein